jgi:hypothetical protein
MIITRNEYLARQEQYLKDHANAISNIYSDNYIALHDTTIVDFDKDIEELDLRIHLRKKTLGDLVNAVMIINPKLHLFPGNRQDPSYEKPRILA